MDFTDLKDRIKGEFYTDDLHRILYATDASSYRELPAAVALPADREDVQTILSFARKNGVSVIPRGAGTSLAGQVVGSGLVIDVSRYMKKILELNVEERWIKVEPGVVLAELNMFLEPYGLFFGPETSTANRCCMAGMLGNNSCGLHSIIYGSVRDHILEVEALLSDGSITVFKEITTEDFIGKCNGDPGSTETAVFNFINNKLSDPGLRELIREQYPHPALKRRNNGYALDSLMDTDPFTGNGRKINLCTLLAGSEGTLAFTLSMKLNLLPLVKKETGLICAHFDSLRESLRGNNIILRHGPAAIEMIDDFILECTKDNIEQNKNRFFIKGTPKIILIVEIFRSTREELIETARNIESDLRKENCGYHFPLFTGEQEIAKIWDLRRAGLGVLLNIPGDKRSVQVIEDTSVLPELLPEYIEEFETVLQKYGLNCSYYAHVATGELHLSPLLDLKDPEDVRLYRTIAREIAMLVKKYRGSLSGEHGDGRLRGEFIPLMVGDTVYSVLKELKYTWDPQNIFNPGKIIDTPPMDQNLRYVPGERRKPLKTTFRFPDKGTVLYAAEKCSGSGDCRKNAAIGGTMCPSFMVSGDEDKSTRGRANILREFLTRSDKKRPYDHEEIYRVMDLCLSCKACKSECPSNVDMTKLKAEFLQHYYDLHGIPLRSLLIAWLPSLNKIAILFRPVSNFLTGSVLFRKTIGFSQFRKVPALSPVTLTGWYKKAFRKDKAVNPGPKGKVYLFADEFTNFNESDIGIKTVLLLERLGYQVVIPKHRESGRTFLSKGLLRQARKRAAENLRLLSGLVTEETPLIGIEPSAILTFRDEYPELVSDSESENASCLGKNALMLEEFFCRELDRGNISPASFTAKPAMIKYHGHCQQKSIASTSFTIRMLRIPSNFIVEEIPSGCCGMAGAFGFEKEHYEMSMKIGEMVLFPAVRKAPPDALISASGTSCRQQIFDGTGRKALHPVEILYDALV